MEYCKLILGVMSLSILLLARNAQGYTPVRGNVTATVGPYLFQTNFQDPQKNYDVPEQWGVGLVALGDVNDSGSLEITAIYMNKKLYALSQGGHNIAEKTQLIHVTMGYRYWPWPYLSTSLGLYTSYPMGDVDVVYNDFPGTAPGTTARSTTETGLDWAVQGQLWGEDRYALIGEARYSYSLTKKSGESADQYGFTLGIRYFVQGDLK